MFRGNRIDAWLQILSGMSQLNQLSTMNDIYFFKPLLENYIVDIAGVINLHGYPAIISMLGTVFACLNGYHTSDL